MTGLWILCVNELLLRFCVSSDVLKLRIVPRVSLAVGVWIAVAAPFKTQPILERVLLVMRYDVGHDIANVELDADRMDDGSQIRILQYPAATGGNVRLFRDPEVWLAVARRVLQRGELRDCVAEAV